MAETPIFDKDKLVNFTLPTDTRKLIKVIGVGGGGGNAVTHMYKEGIQDVSFVLCNTDFQALKGSDVPTKIAIGELGAGGVPKVAEEAAESHEEKLRGMLNDGTKMVFITAGMGGGTGTGAGPVIAKLAKEMGILTVGIVTIPFLFEGQPKIIQALTGVEKMSQNVDALLVVNNQRVYEIHGKLTVKEAFGKADDTLSIAAKSIAEIITLPGIINLDFADVNSTMKNGGVALMSEGYGEGEGRLEKAIENALTSPLLNNNDIFNAEKILFNISYGPEDELQMDELNFINDFMARFGNRIKVIWGTALDKSLGKKVKFTVLATGFGLDDIPEMRKKHLDEQGHLTEEEMQQEEERRLKEQKENDLIRKYYGDQTRTRQIHKVSRASIAVLTLAEMDDDHLISLIEEHPTYNRDPKLLSHARSQSAIAMAASQGGGITNAASPEKKKISFK